MPATAFSRTFSARRPRTTPAALARGVAPLAAALVVGLGALGPSEVAAAPRPNIVVVQTDDQDAASVSARTMPNVARLLQRPGTTFTNFVASGPLCCPGRAVLLTGQYGHNNGVLWNEPRGYGDLRDKANTLPVWLRRAGYRTVHVGKYLNLYPQAVGDPNAVAPGWADWQTALEPFRYQNYVLRDNGRAVSYGWRAQEHLTRVLNRRARRVVERIAPSAQPFFLSVDHLAPHRSGYLDPRCRNFPSPDPVDREAFLDEPLPRPPSFNEPDVSDKPSFVRGRPPIPGAGVASVAHEHGCRLASLRAVDRGVAGLVDALRRTGDLDDTVFVLTSDNGWLAGQHRVPGGKILPYEETLRVPLVVRLPGRLHGASPPPSRTGIPTANIDLAPTLLALAGARPCRVAGACRTLDGRSLVPLLRGRQDAWPRGRGVLLELQAPGQRAPAFQPCDYEGIRAGRRVLIEHRSSTGAFPGACQPRFERELYALRDDPFQLRNLAAPRPGGAAGSDPGLEARLGRLRDCAGVAGRDPRPPSGHFCE